MMSCHFAATAHRIFAFDLERLVEGTELVQHDSNVIANAGACELGKWILDREAKYATLPHFQELCLCHQRFHEVAGEMVRKLDSGDIQGARVIEETTFRDLSASVLAAIEAMSEELDRGAGKA
jgi:hypothetical protein